MVPAVTTISVVPAVPTVPPPAGAEAPGAVAVAAAVAGAAVMAAAGEGAETEAGVGEAVPAGPPRVAGDAGGTGTPLISSGEAPASAARSLSCTVRAIENVEARLSTTVAGGLANAFKVLQPTTPPVP